MQDTFTVDPRRIEPDAHGQAALLLNASMLHLMVDKGAMTNAEAMEVIEIAQEVKFEVATADGESKRRIHESLDLLSGMSATFAIDA